MTSGVPNPMVPPRDAGTIDLSSTARLLERVRSGDGPARNELFRRYLVPLRRWAHGRLPGRARSLKDTDDLVQGTLLRALMHVERFEPRHPGAFLAFLRTTLLNQIRDEIRAAERRPRQFSVDIEVPSGDPDPATRYQWVRRIERYEEAMGQLTELQRNAIFLRLELAAEYQTVADELGFKTANAARMCVVRAVARLADLLRENHG